MSQTALIAKINTDTEAEVASIEATVKTEVAQIEREAEAAVGTLKEASKVSVEKQQKHQELVTTSQAKQVGNIALQTAKRQQIDTIFGEVLSELQSQDTAEYVKFFVAQAKDVLPKDVEVTAVQAPKARTEETKDILKELGISVDVKDDSSIQAGLVVYAADGVYDVTLDRLFTEKRSELEMQIVTKALG